MSGANHTQPYPVVTTVKLANGQLTVKGTLQSDPSTNHAVELFGNAACDPSRFGEGMTYLAQVKVLTDASGQGSFTVNIPYNGAAKPVVTATATNVKKGTTSEFSACK
ncbi:MAG TPA: hypothetical protein VGB19_17000 [Actinomycetota bacterium]